MDKFPPPPPADHAPSRHKYTVELYAHLPDLGYSVNGEILTDFVSPRDLELRVARLYLSVLRDLERSIAPESMCGIACITSCIFLEIGTGAIIHSTAYHFGQILPSRIANEVRLLIEGFGLYLFSNSAGNDGYSPTAH